MRKSYGNTWWGKQWLQALTAIDFSNRLPRGRTYANKGAVVDIHCKGNHIQAKVQGTRRRPYEVEITVPRFSPPERRAVLEAIESHPLLLSQLQNRVLPQALFDLCRQQGIQLFPASWNDLDGDCSCPDWAVPCKHMAAVLYLVANEIDNNPFLVFSLHGFDLLEELQSQGTAADKTGSVPALADRWQASPAEQPHFEWSPAIYEGLDFSRVPDCRENLLRLHTTEPAFYPEGVFSDVLDKAFKKVARELAGYFAHGTAQEAALPRQAGEVQEVRITLDENGVFMRAVTRQGSGESIAIFHGAEELAEWLRQIPLARLNLLALPLRGLVLTFHLAVKLLQCSAVVPELLAVSDDRYFIRWWPAYLNEHVWEVADMVESLCPPNLLLYELPRSTKVPLPEDDFPALIGFWLNHFMAQSLGPAVAEEDAVYRLFFRGRRVRFTAFAERSYPAAIHAWLQRFFLGEKSHLPAILVEEEADGQFALHLAVEEKGAGPKPLTPLRDFYRPEVPPEQRMAVMRDLALVLDYLPDLGPREVSRGEAPLRFTAERFAPVLLEVLPTVQLLGIKVVLPKALRKLWRPSLSLQIDADAKGQVGHSGIISLDNMLRFNWQVALGDQLVDPSAFLRELRKLSGIVKFNDQYVLFDEKEVTRLVRQLEQPPKLSGIQVLHAALTEDFQGSPITLSREARDLLKQLTATTSLPAPEGLLATLRPYQQKGFEWLYKNSRLGLGSLIADDMGLGKTLQVIAALLQLKLDGVFADQKGLIVVPTSLLTNWEREIKRFAPALKPCVYHGSSRDLDDLNDADLMITTYGIARSDTKRLGRREWSVVVIDEAQHIKNPAAAQTKAVKSLRSSLRIAMSGTPVENRLSEYWSIFDFTNKGYLGSLNAFKEDFAKPIELERDQRQLRRFRSITSPFILRRLKSDKSIIDDLPDKVEIDQYCRLTEEQAALYQSVVDNTMQEVEASDGMQRRGLILKLMTALKQVCNHPRHFLKQGPLVAAQSGKTERLLSLLQTILDNEEKALIFTQYREMGDLLTMLFQDDLGMEAPFLHGGVSRRGRDEIVADFQNNPQTRLLLLSLKAGGTGLNLTAATNVIHFDLWWNPAVETQATDRAYRIGQERNVMVHRFITQATFEEKIDQLLQSKKELADLAVTTGDRWIGELSNRELKSLVQLDS